MLAVDRPQPMLCKCVAIIALCHKVVQTSRGLQLSQSAQLPSGWKAVRALV